MHTTAESRDNYLYFMHLDTRWSDNDIYGHVNNVTYYSYFDTAANRFLIEKIGFDPYHDAFIGLVINSGCDYFAALAYPERLEIGLRIGHLGRSSLRYEIAIFQQGKATAAAQGHFVHVFVDRHTRQSTAIPDHMREALTSYIVQPT